MKKTLIALAALAATGAVMAQSSVTIYGVIDQAYSRTSISGGTSKNEMVSSGNVTNRLGFRGTEDLGGGLKAKFQVETNLVADAPGGSTIGDRGAWVALASDSMGEIRLGREYNPTFWNPISFSAFGTNGSGRSLAHPARTEAFKQAGYKGGSFGSDPYTWNNNSITYILPSTLGGVYGSVQYGIDEKANSGTVVQGSALAMRVGYKSGPLDVAFAYGTVEDKDTAPAASDVKSMNLGGSYDFGVAKLLAVWYQDKLKDATTGATQDKLTGYEIGVVLPLGPGNLRAAYGSVKFDDLTPAADEKANKFAIGYVYPLSKRTSVYTTYARVSNKNGLAMTTTAASGAVANRSVSGIDFGISHTF